MSNDLVKPGAGLPEYLAGYQFDAADDGFDSSDVVMPRIKLLQGTSKEVEEFDEAKAGLFWHTGAEISLGSSITFVVADRRKKYLLTAPIEDGQGVLARADDAKNWDRLGKWSVKSKLSKKPLEWEIKDLDLEKSGLAEWGTFDPSDPDSPPAATLFYDYLVFLPDHLDLGPGVISLARSQIKKAKKGLNDKIQFHKNNRRPMQAVLFSATSVDDSADGQSFKNWQFRNAGFNQDPDLFLVAREYEGTLRAMKIKDEAEIDEEKSPVSDDESF